MASTVAVTTGHAGRWSATLGKRALTAAVGIPLFVWVVLAAPRWTFTLLASALSAVAAWELMRLFERAGRPGFSGLAVVGAAVITASFAAPVVSDAVPTPVVVFTAVLTLALTAPAWREGTLAVEPVASTLLAVAYVGWLLGYGVLLARLPDGPALVLFLVGTTWAGESAAYAVGSLIGRHPLAPVISPRKTVEGAVGHLVVSVLAAGGLGAWLLPHWSPWVALSAGALLGAVGQIGDLVESVIKRSLGAKDTGGLIPGHGGVLDRLDGLLFNAPALFYYASWVGGRG